MTKSCFDLFPVILLLIKIICLLIRGIFAKFSPVFNFQNVFLSLFKISATSSSFTLKEPVYQTAIMFNDLLIKSNIIKLINIENIKNYLYL